MWQQNSQNSGGLHMLVVEGTLGLHLLLQLFVALQCWQAALSASAGGFLQDDLRRCLILPDAGA